MQSEILLDELLDGPTMTVQAGSRRLLFGELPLAALGRLQGWLRANAPHPVSSLAGRLDGLSDADRRHLLDKAHEEARHWPPVIGSPAAARALLGSDAGLIEVIYEGLLVHQPGSTRDDAARLVRALSRRVEKAIRAAKGTGVRPAAVDDVMKLTAVLFGTADADADADEGRVLPKAGAGETTPAATGG